MKEASPLPVRAVQLDLARQMETVDFIKQFTRFIRDFGYNTLVLYLEGRIRTRAFPWPSGRQSYTPEQMRAVVEHAGRLGVQVIPVVPSLSHAGQFLRFPRMRPMAELREGRRGRFGSGLHTFCTSTDRTYEFLESYLSELGAIFPSGYVHVGNDEAWDFCLCSRCRRRLAGGATPAAMLAEHIVRMHGIVAGKLGKRMLIWDDMFEQYPDALPLIPRDIILCCWQYDSLVDLPKTHLGYRVRQDSFSRYDRLGFKYWMCPVDWHPRNTESFHQYAVRYAPSGGLLTTWSKRQQFLLENYPNIAFAGLLWKGADIESPDALYRKACARLFGLKDPLFLAALPAVKNRAPWPDGSDVQSFLRGPLTAYESEREKQTALLQKTLEPYLRRVSAPEGRNVLQDILLDLRREMAQLSLRRLLTEIVSRRSRNRRADIRGLLAQCAETLDEVRRIQGLRKEQWNRFRPGIKPIYTEAHYRTLCRNVESFLRTVRTRRDGLGILSVLYFLPDFHGVPNVRLSIKWQGESGWAEVYSGCPKQNEKDFSQLPYHTYEHVLPVVRIPRKLRIESFGYGGIGVAFAEVANPAGRYVPLHVGAVAGIVRDPAHLLVNDTRWCYLGGQDAREAYRNPRVAAAKHWVEVDLIRS